MRLRIKLPRQPYEAEYCESSALTYVDGFLMCYGDYCRITINAHLSPERKAEGVRYLVGQFRKARKSKAKVFVWSRKTEKTHPGTLNPVSALN